MSLTKEDVAQIITLMRRAPLQNMAEAEVASQLMQKLAAAYQHDKAKVLEETASEPTEPNTKLNGHAPRRKKNQVNASA